MSVLKHFVFTLNNYTAEEEAFLRGPLSGNLTYLCYGREVGASGTPHLQGYAQISKQTKWSTIDRYPGFGRMWHKGALGSSDEARAYCYKEGETFEQGVFTHIDGVRGKRNDLEAVKKAIDNGESYDDICEAHFEQAAKYGRFIKERIAAKGQLVARDEAEKEIAGKPLRAWQTDLVEICMATPDERAVHWIWEPVGNIGKSFVAKYLMIHHNALILEPAKKADMALIFAEDPKPIVIFDLTRSTEPRADGLNPTIGAYTLAEGLKNGHICSMKYQSKAIIFQRPHVIFLANYPPMEKLLSADRWRIKRL